MSDFLRLINHQESYVEVGVVDGEDAVGRYNVTIRGKIVKTRAAIDKPLAKGATVIVNVTANGKYIVGVTTEMKDHYKREVVVDG